MLQTFPSKQLSVDNISGEDEHSPIFTHLREILDQFMEFHPQLSLNGLAKRSTVSEPTLRRIRNGQLKTIPEVTTIIDLLCYISKEADARKIPLLFPGPLSEFLKSKMPQIDAHIEIQVSDHLTEKLKNPVKYIIYKLASNDEGVCKEKVLDLFGNYGASQLKALVQENLVVEDGEAYFARVANFCLMNEVFVEHFKATADFIKPENVTNSPKNLSPLFTNYSSGLNKKGYSEILKIQRQALRKIREVMVDQKFKGSIPSFYLSAVDTLDSKSADDFDKASGK